jgi:ABC-type multidrug transport system fused ATPase/permease subunit
MCTYAEKFDYIILIFSWIGTVCFAVATPASLGSFGNMMDSLGGNEGIDSIGTQALTMVILGFILMIASCWQAFFGDWFAQRITLKIKVAYLQALLKKDGKYFDQNTCSQMSARISKETTAIQTGIGQKINTVWGSLLTFVLSFVIAFTWGWKYTLILLAFIPLIGIVGGAFAGMDNTEAVMKAQAQSSGFAEQALNSIKVVQSFGREELEAENYVKYLQNSIDVGREGVIGIALSQGGMYGVIYVFYAYSFWFGSVLIGSKDESFTGTYSGGEVFAIMFIVMVGGFFIGNIPVHSGAVNDAKIGGKLAFDVIHHQSDIPTDDKNAKKVDSSTF